MAGSWPKHIWDQLKNLTAQDLINALDKRASGWTKDHIKGAVHVYYNPNRPPGKRYVSMHRHPSKTYGPGQLRELLDTIGWTPSDLRRLKLIK